MLNRIARQQKSHLQNQLDLLWFQVEHIIASPSLVYRQNAPRDNSYSCELHKLPLALNVYARYVYIKEDVVQSQ
jgi:hypothetical protein